MTLSPRLSLLFPALALACFGDADKAGAPASAAVAPPAAAPAELPIIAATDCEALCARLNTTCGLDAWTIPESPRACWITCETGKDGAAEQADMNACVAAASDCAAVSACVAERPLEDAWMVIAAGSTDPDEASAMFDAYRAAGGPAHGDYPRLLSSDTVEGLNPGFRIVVAAAPASKDAASGLRDHLRGSSLAGLDTSGAYIKAVKVRDAEDLSRAALVPVAWRAIIIWQTTYETSEDWGFFTDDVHRAANAAGIPLIWAGDSPRVPVEIDGASVATVDLTGKTPNPIGYVFAMEGREPHWEDHSPSFTVVEHAADYFGTELAIP